MARVLLLSAEAERGTNAKAGNELERMRESAQHDAFGTHELTDDPHAADVILFVELGGRTDYFESVRQHPYVQRHREKCFLYTDVDETVPFLPGVYAAAEERWLLKSRVRGGHYLRVFTHDFLQCGDADGERPYLFSFLGRSDTDPLRTKLLTLEHPRGYTKDTAPYSPYGKLTPEERRAFEQHYADVCCGSQFILCPRGKGPSSYRLYETLRMGRVPVILADQWVPPDGPDWPAFSVRVREQEWQDVPAILEDIEEQAFEMGERARAVWAEWFSREASFHRVVEWCLDIQRSRRLPERVLRYSAYAHLLHPQRIRDYLRWRTRTRRAASVDDGA